jgi:tetratricopeptide (TPR) repeat protein
VFEQCLGDRLRQTQAELAAETSEIRQAKVGRILRAMQTIQGEWTRWQERDRGTDQLAASVRNITEAPAAGRLTELIRAFDPNRAECLSIDQVRQLGQFLRQQGQWTADPDLRQDMQQMAEGIDRGLKSWQPLQDNLVSWVYAPSQEMGLGAQDANNPWYVWSKHLTTPFLQELFRRVYEGQSLAEFADAVPSFEVADWVELAIVMQYLQQGAIGWFDRLVYSARLEQKLAASTFVLFVILWMQVAYGFQQSRGIADRNRGRFADSSYHMGLQTLRIFSQRRYFPLYGNGLATFHAVWLEHVVAYLREPLKASKEVSEEARIITLAGYSERVRQDFENAKKLHSAAQELAATQGDRPCEIANLNHLSRIDLLQADYDAAIPLAQRALMLSRQEGDRWGQGNALVNLGRSQVLQAQAQEQGEAEVYAGAIAYLNQGIAIGVDVGDYASLALAYHSLGIAYLLMEQHRDAIVPLREGLKMTGALQDMDLQGSMLRYLGEAFYRNQDLDKALYMTTIGMYYLERVESREWRQAAGLLVVIQGKLGDRYDSAIAEVEADIVTIIGREGFEHIPVLLAQYRGRD